MSNNSEWCRGMQLRVTAASHPPAPFYPAADGAAVVDAAGTLRTLVSLCSVQCATSPSPGVTLDIMR